MEPEHSVEIRVSVFAWPALSIRSRITTPSGWIRALWLREGSSTVVADEWIGEDEQLSRVRGVGEGFLVADHACLEDKLANGHAGSACSSTFYYGAVGHDENTHHRFSSVHSFPQNLTRYYYLSGRVV